MMHAFAEITDIAVGAELAAIVVESRLQRMDGEFPRADFGVRFQVFPFYGFNPSLEDLFAISWLLLPGEEGTPFLAKEGFHGEGILGVRSAHREGIGKIFLPADFAFLRIIRQSL